MDLIKKGSNRARATIDGWFLPDHPARVFQEGKQADIPVIIGTTRDEGNFFVYSIKFEKRTEMFEKLSDFYGDATGAIMAHYPGESASELKQAGSRFITDAWSCILHDNC